MLREGPIPGFVQGVIEYLLGLFFIAAPFLLDYDDSSAPLGISITVGVLLLIIAAIADSPTGLVKQLPITAHVTVDFLMSIFLIAAPFVLGFGDEATPRNLFIAAGVVFLLVTIGSRYRESAGPDAKAGAGSRPVAPAPSRSAAAPPPSRPAPSSTSTASTGAAGSGQSTGSAGSAGSTGSTGSGQSTGSAGSAGSGGSPVPPSARPLDPPGDGTRATPPTP